MNRVRIMLLLGIFIRVLKNRRLEGWTAAAGSACSAGGCRTSFSEKSDRAFRIFFPQRKRPADFFVVSESAYGMKLCPWCVLSKNFFFRTCGRLSRCAQTFQFFLGKTFGPEGDVHKAWRQRNGMFSVPGGEGRKGFHEPGHIPA